jgi:hypothetical protein
MIDELNAKCGLELSHEYSLYRPTLTSKPDRHDVFEDELEKVVLMGGSHSVRMTHELDDTCLEVVNVSVRGWRISEKAGEEKAKELSEIVSQCDEKRTTVVISCTPTAPFTLRNRMAPDACQRRARMENTMWKGSWKLLLEKKPSAW